MPRPSFKKDTSMRRSSLVSLAIAIMLALAASAPFARAADGDVEGSHDYPGIGRFAGSVITGYDAKDFDATRLQTAPFKDGQPTGEKRPEGKVTRIAYRTGAGPSILEVSRNFETQLAKAGFETLLACNVDDCGGIPFSEALDVLPMPQMWVDGFNYRYFAGHKAGENGAETYATVLVSQNNDEITAELVVTEVGAIANKMVDAAAMAKGLGDGGHIALYGIYFDTDKAVMKPESRPTLDEIAKLLTGPARPQGDHRRPHRQPGRLRLQHGPVEAPRRSGRRRSRQDLQDRLSAAADRRRRLPRAGRLQRDRGRPRAKPAGGAGGAVAALPKTNGRPGRPLCLRSRSRAEPQLSKKLRSFLVRLGCLSFLSAFASIWRMRSRVTENCWPTSSSVWSVFMPMPKRMRSTRSSRGVMTPERASLFHEDCSGSRRRSAGSRSCPR